jgi:hypothetical protein
MPCEAIIAATMAAQRRVARILVFDMGDGVLVGECFVSLPAAFRPLVGGQQNI